MRDATDAYMAALPPCTNMAAAPPPARITAFRRALYRLVHERRGCLLEFARTNTARKGPGLICVIPWRPKGHVHIVFLSYASLEPHLLSWLRARNCIRISDAARGDVFSVIAHMPAQGGYFRTHLRVRGLMK